jgi:hypothetical protein
MLMPVAFEMKVRMSRRLVFGPNFQSIELNDFIYRLSVAGVVLDRSTVFRQRSIELVFGFELARIIEVHARRIEHRPFEPDPILGLVGISLDRLPIVGDRRVPVSDARAVLSSSECPSCRAPGKYSDCNEERSGAGPRAPASEATIVSGVQGGVPSAAAALGCERSP